MFRSCKSVSNNTYTIHIQYVSEKVRGDGERVEDGQAISLDFGDEDNDDPFEVSDEKRVAAAGMNLGFVFRLHRVCPVVPFKRFVGNKVVV